MSVFAALRAPARRSGLVATPRVAARSTMRMRSFRKYSTESTQSPKPESSNTWLYASIGGAALVSAGYYVYSTSDSAKTAAKSTGQAIKVKTNFVPTKEDYQKVRPLAYSTYDQIKLIIHRFITILLRFSRKTANMMV